MTVSRMSIAHAESMAEIEAACFSMPWTFEQIKQELSHSYSYYWSALEGSVLIGYAGMNVVLDEGHITNVAVRPEYRRRHVASELIARLVDESGLLGLAFLTLEVRESNFAAIKLYSRFGFEVQGLRRGYYVQPVENALIMNRYTDKG